MNNPNNAVQGKHLEAAVEVAKQYTDHQVATVQGGGSAATYSVATTSENGLMSSTDKAKLDNLASITTAGTNITIQGGTISSANTTYTAGSNITINGTTISGTANTTYSAASTTTAGLMSAADKQKLNNLASITTAGDNITIQGGTIKAAGGGTYSEATTLQAGLMSATDKQHLDSLFQDTTEFVDTVLAGLSGKFFPDASTMAGVIEYYDNFDRLENKYQKILEGTNFYYKAYANVGLLPDNKEFFRGVEYKLYYSGSNSYFGTGDSVTSTRVTLAADNSTLANWYYLVKINDNAGLIYNAKESIQSSTGYSKVASLAAQAFIIPSTGKPSIGSAASILSTAAYMDSDGYSQYEIYAVRSIFDQSHILTQITRYSAADTFVDYYNTIYHKDTTAFTTATATASLGTSYMDTAGKTNTDPTKCFFPCPKVTFQANSNTVRLNVAGGGSLRYVPFLYYKQTTYNASGAVTKWYDYLIVHHGINRASPTKITLRSQASATAAVVTTNPWFEDYGYIAGCWLDKSRTSCYVITLATTDYIPKSTPNLIKTLFDNAAKVFVFDFRTPAIILTNYKLSDIIDDLLL